MIFSKYPIGYPPHVKIERGNAEADKTLMRLPTANKLGKKVKSYINPVMFSITYKSVTNFAFCIKH